MQNWGCSSKELFNHLWKISNLPLDIFSLANHAEFFTKYSLSRKESGGSWRKICWCFFVCTFYTEVLVVWTPQRPKQRIYYFLSNEGKPGFIQFLMGEKSCFFPISQIIQNKRQICQHNLMVWQKRGKKTPDMLTVR